MPPFAATSFHKWIQVCNLNQIFERFKAGPNILLFAGDSIVAPVEIRNQHILITNQNSWATGASRVSVILKTNASSQQMLPTSNTISDPSCVDQTSQQFLPDPHSSLLPLNQCLSTYCSAHFSRYALIIQLVSTGCPRIRWQLQWYTISV